MNKSRNMVTKEGIESFLKGSLTKGVGSVFAGRITKKFGDEILQPDFNFEKRLREIPGFGETKIREFISSLNNLKTDLPTLAELYSCGLPDREIVKITDHYGKRTSKILAWDPYDMVENVWKFSFFSADKIGKGMGISADDPRRLRGAVLTAIKYYAEEGNMFATEAQALQTASRISGQPVSLIKPQIDELLESGRLVKSLDGLYLPVYFRAEEEAAEKLRQLMSRQVESVDWGRVPEKDLQGHVLSELQKQAIFTVMNNNVSVITGGPGTGKTTIVMGVVRLLEESGRKVVLAAPTGRAAKKMSNLTGEEAKTIHRLLGYSMGRGYKNKKLEADVLVIDEASMLEQVLFNHLLQAIGDNTKVVLVGDTDQLPAIGAGNVLKDMIDSGKVPTVCLEENFRQADGSLISSSAAEIRQGVVPGKTPGEDFVIVEEDSAANIHDRLMSLVAEELPAYLGISPMDIQVVSPQQEGALGARQLNIDLRDRINSGAQGITHGVKSFRMGDRVMQILNSTARGIYNGETGKVTEVNTEEKTIEVTFNDGKKSVYGEKDFKELTLAYATTVHKLQGSETDYMVMVVSSAHAPMLYRNLIYTGVSRARKLCVILGEASAIATAVRNRPKSSRNSNFKERL